MDKVKATEYIASLLGKTLRITTADKRMFRGQFRCTDADCNIVIDETFEYLTSLSVRSGPANKEGIDDTLDPTPRFLGLVVIPGIHINRIELEEFESQIRGSEKNTS